MANYFDQFEVIEEANPIQEVQNNNQKPNNNKSYWEQFEVVEDKTSNPNVNSDEPIFDDSPLSFSEEHPILYKGLNGVKRAINGLGNFVNDGLNQYGEAINEKGQATQAPVYLDEYGKLYGGLEENIYKGKVRLKNIKDKLKTNINSFGDKALRNLAHLPSAMVQQNINPITQPELFQKVSKQADPTVETEREKRLAGTREDYEKLKQVRKNGVKTKEDAKLIYDDLVRKYQNVEKADKALTAGFISSMAIPLIGGGVGLPSAGGKIVTGAVENSIKRQLVAKLIQQGVTEESANLMVDNAIKKGFVEYAQKRAIEQALVEKGLYNEVTNAAANVAANATKIAGMAAIDMGLLGTGLNAYTNYLDLTDNNPLLGGLEAAEAGGKFGFGLGAGFGVLPYAVKAASTIPLWKTTKPYNPTDIVPYNPKAYGENLKYGYTNGKGFYTYPSEAMTKSRPTEPAAEPSRGANVKEIAPKTYEKQQGADLQSQNSAAESGAVASAVSEIAPKIAEKQNRKIVTGLDENGYKQKYDVTDLSNMEKVGESEYDEKFDESKHVSSEGMNLSRFKKGDVVKNVYNNRKYEVLEPSNRNGIGKIKDIETNKEESLNAENNAFFTKDESDVAEKIEKIAPKTAAKQKSVKPNKKIKTRMTDSIYETDNYYTDGNFMVRKGDFELSDKNFVTKTGGLREDAAQTLWKQNTQDSEVIADDVKPTGRIWNGKQLKAVEFEYTDKDGNKQNIYLPKRYADMFKGYDLSLVKNSGMKNFIAKENGNPVGIAVSLTDKAALNIKNNPDNFETVEAKQPTKRTESNGKPTIKYVVKVDRNGNQTGVFWETEKYHTDGNASYLKEYVNADTTRVQRNGRVDDSMEKHLDSYFNAAEKYPVKLNELGKIKEIKNGKGKVTDKARIFEAEYDGQKVIYAVNDKYLLDKKGYDLYVDNIDYSKFKDKGTGTSPISLRKDGKQIGLIMPIQLRDNVSDFISVEKMKPAAPKKEVKTEEVKEPESNIDTSLPEIKKTTVTLKSGKQKDIEYVEEIPDGFIQDVGATTAPKGYSWYHNNKSITSGERKRILVKDKAFEEKEPEQAENKYIKEYDVKDVYKIENIGKEINVSSDDLQLKYDAVKSLADKYANDKKYSLANAYDDVASKIQTYLSAQEKNVAKQEVFNEYKKLGQKLIDNKKITLSELNDIENEVIGGKSTPTIDDYNEIINRLKKIETEQEKSQTSEKIDLSKYSDEELESALNTYKNAAATASEYGEEQVAAEKEMLDAITNEIENRKQKTVKPKEKISKKKDSGKLEDAGEFLKGNRKEDKSLTWNDLEGMNDLIRAKNTTKAKIMPKQSIEDLKTEGFSEFQAAIIQNIYNKINAKPAAGYTTKADQKLYVDSIKEVMETVKDYIKSNPDEFTTDLIADAAKKARSWSYDYNKSLFNAIFPDKENKMGRYSNIFRIYPEHNKKAIIIGGNKFVKALTLDTQTLKDIAKVIEDSKVVKDSSGKVKKDDWEKNFTILEPDRWNNKYSVANKGSKHILAEYDTKEEAIAAAKRVQEKIEAMKNKKANFTRDYIERRENGKDVTTEELKEAFGFRGVNFGNWATAKERQNFANYAYDSLFDLSELLNLPPKALSLNGQLGLAYGAQGHGGKAAAHYLPAYKDINLTKEYGAGSLAHEWWHAVDNYFANQANGKEFSQDFALSLYKQGNLRPETFEALKNLQKQIKESPFTEEDIKENAKRLTERTERNIKYYADNIKNKYKRAKDSEKLLKIVDDLVENKEKYKSYTTEQLQEIENKFFKMLPENRDTMSNRGEFNWLLSAISRLNDIEELARKGSKKSEYLKNAEKIDSQRPGKTYWSLDTELGARAFSAYLFNKMENQNILNRFLVDSEGSAVLNMDYFKELAEGEEKGSIAIPTNPTNPEEKARIYKAFEDLFKTIKTRETDKGVELYSKYGDTNEEIQKFIEEMYAENLPKEQDYIFYQRGVEPHDTDRIILTYLGDLIKHPAYRYLGKKILGIEDVPIYMASKVDIEKCSNAAAFYSPKNDSIIVTPDLPPWFLEHEIRHAKDYRFLSYSKKGRQELKKASDVNLALREADKEYEKNPNIVNKIKLMYRDFVYRHCKIEKFSYNEQKEAFKNYERRKNNSDSGQIGSKDKGKNVKTFQGKGGSERKIQGLGGNFQSRISGNRKVPGRSAETNNSGRMGTDTQPIQEKVKDKIYEWHGNIGKDRFDVDKHLNSFINTSKSIAKEYSKKFGMKVSDKMVREILPFLRERTEFPEKLNRPDLEKFYSNLSGTEKARLTKFADDVSAKFEKYYKNYQEAKGVEDAEGIENHISHIWDLDKKHKSLLTNYFTTSSRFAKERTIDTLVKGIDGFEVNGELIQFKPKTLDYAEILKSSSDNLIKATHDMILANEIKNFKYKGERLVKAASKAPSDWVEINHPALNKAVYAGTTEDDNIILSKGAVKVHPAIADKIQAIFEVQKPDNLGWKVYDNLNGLLKQSTLGFSGFHGYALSESAASNMGIKNTLKSMNFKKIYDSVAKGDYEIFKKEEIAKRAIDDGLQIGTPSDLNRNQVEEFIGKIPVVGNFLKSTVSANNKVLWDCLHTIYKIDTYDYMVQEAGGYENTTKQQRRAIAQWVNDSFGGQAWELLGVKKSTIKAASRLLLSPDWNFSTIRQTMGLLDTKKGNSILSAKDNEFWKYVKNAANMLGASEAPGSNGVRGKAAKNFFLKFIIYSAIGYNLINAAFREKDRKEHPDLYPKKMKPIDYTIWSNTSPSDKTFDKIFPYVFIGRNSDGSARYLRVGKQVREVPEMIADPVNKFGGKSSSLINLICQTALGISPADVPKKLLGKDEDVYYNQNIWSGYGKYAKRKEGAELYKGMAKTVVKNAAPFVMSKAMDEKHEMSAWDMFAQTSKGTTYGKAVRQYKLALEQGKESDMKKITRKAYQDGLSREKIDAAKKAALKNYRADNTAKYKHKYIDAMQNKDKKELQNITNQMRKNHLSVEEQKRIYDKAYKEYLKGGR